MPHARIVLGSFTQMPMAFSRKIATSPLLLLSHSCSANENDIDCNIKAVGIVIALLRMWYYEYFLLYQ